MEIAFCTVICFTFNKTFDEKEAYSYGNTRIIFLNKSINTPFMGIEHLRYFSSNRNKSLSNAYFKNYIIMSVE